MGGEGQNGEGDRKVPLKEFPGDEALTSEIVDDQSDLRSKDCLSRCRLKHDKNQLVSPSILNPYIQMKGFR